MKILLSAYACEPHKGSEPGVGWSFACEISQSYPTWVITRENNRFSIEKELANNPNPNLHFIYHDLPRWASWWKRGGRGVQLYYYLWQLAGKKIAEEYHKKIHFDCAHHVTFGKYWSPTFLSGLKIPYLFGPVGGAETIPFRFLPTLGLYGIIYELLRTMVRYLSEFDPNVYRSIRNAELVIVKAPETLKRIEKLGAKNPILFSEVGFSEDEIRFLESINLKQKTPFRVVSVGRLMRWKGQYLGLKAFAKSGVEDLEYWIIGDGPDKNHLVKLASDLGISDKVVFWGALSRQETLKRISESHVLIHPTLHDSGGWVCLEAMALGKPVICLNLGGPAAQVIEQTGIKINVQYPQQTILELSKAIRTLKEDESLRNKMGTRARKHVAENFAWRNKRLVLENIYMSFGDKNDVK